MKRLLFFLLGLAVGAAGGAIAAPLPFLSGKATITRIESAISTDPAAPTLTVEAQAINDGTITGGTCTIVTANSKAAQQFTVGAVVKLVLGGK